MSFQRPLFLDHPPTIIPFDPDGFHKGWCSVLFDFRCVDHTCRAVAHLGKVWVYHAHPQDGEDYIGHLLTMIEEVEAGPPLAIVEAILTGKGVTVFTCDNRWYEDYKKRRDKQK